MGYKNKSHANHATHAALTRVPDDDVLEQQGRHAGSLNSGFYTRPAQTLAPSSVSRSFDPLLFDGTHRKLRVLPHTTDRSRSSSSEILDWAPDHSQLGKEGVGQRRGGRGRYILVVYSKQARRDDILNVVCGCTTESSVRSAPSFARELKRQVYRARATCVSGYRLRGEEGRDGPSENCQNEATRLEKWVRGCFLRLPPFLLRRVLS